MKVYEVIPGKLYFRGEFSRQQNRVTALRALGITDVVSLHKYDPAMHAFAYWYQPIPDGKRFPPFMLNLAWRLASAIAGDHTILIHCQAGKNRSGLLTALVLREVEGISGRAARERIQSLRPTALDNFTFARLLDRLPTPTGGTP